jgi:hypothetical protein
LAVGDVFDRPLKPFTVWAAPRIMTLSHKRENTKAGHSGLGVGRRGEGAVRLLRCRQKRKAAINGGVDSSPFLGRQNFSRRVVGTCGSGTL